MSLQERKMAIPIHRHTEKCHVTTEAKIEVLELQAKEHQRLLENHQKLERGKKMILPYRFQRKHNPADNLISDF